MGFVFTELFQGDYERLPPNVQRALDKALKFLSSDPHHPALRIKKLPGTSIWYARASRAHRFTFQLDGSTIVLRRVGTHGVLRKER